MDRQDWRGIALVCDRQGNVVEFVSGEGQVAEAGGQPADSLFNLIDSASAGKCRHFLEALQLRRGAFDWLMNVRCGALLLPLHFAGIANSRQLWIVAARDRAGIEPLFDELASKCAKTPDELQSAASRLRQDAARSESHDDLLDEMSRLNNELVNLHRQLAKKNIELERANQQLSEYNHFVSHDIRAPLRAIRNYVAFLSEDLSGQLAGEQQEYLEGLQRAASQAHDLVRDLRRVTGIEREAVQWTDVDVSQLVKDVFASLRLTRKADLVLVEDLPVIRSDASLLRQMFENLISNAVKFNRAPLPRVEVGMDRPRPGDVIRFFVRDNGLGIAPEDRERIFNTFERLHADSEFEGTGIGLAIVGRVVKKLGGAVSVESTPGAGSTFYVQLSASHTRPK